MRGRLHGTRFCFRQIRALPQDCLNSSAVVGLAGGSVQVMDLIEGHAGAAGTTSAAPRW